jgi:thymidylate synthase
MISKIDDLYVEAVSRSLREGIAIETANHEVLRGLGIFELSSFPLVTVRKTAWKKALKEMEWFMSGSPTCPPELLDWWGGQLTPFNAYYRGYSEQLRKFQGVDELGFVEQFDQLKYILDGLRNHPYSRRLCMTTWNPADMANITSINSNPHTPSCCHGSFVQFVVNPDRSLGMIHYARSQDILLGMPHNWVQWWAVLVWLANLADLDVGRMLWIAGDLHLYTAISHMNVARQMDVIYRSDPPIAESDLELKWKGDRSKEEFKAEDFYIVGDIQEPIIKDRPELILPCML